MDAKTTPRLFRQGKAGERLVAVVLTHSKRTGKSYRVATEDDRACYHRAKAALTATRQRLSMEWGIDGVPDEPLPPVGTLGFRIQRYGMKVWGDLFTSRQQLALVTFANKVRQAHGRMLAGRMEPEFAKAHYWLGQIYAERNRLKKARAAFEAALRIDPDYDEAKVALEKVKAP